MLLAYEVLRAAQTTMRERKASLSTDPEIAIAV
jgi:hypothetical protein